MGRFALRPTSRTDRSRAEEGRPSRPSRRPAAAPSARRWATTRPQKAVTHVEGACGPSHFNPLSTNTHQRRHVPWHAAFSSSILALPKSPNISAAFAKWAFTSCIRTMYRTISFREYNPEGIICRAARQHLRGTTVGARPRRVFKQRVPVLGICYGMFTMAVQLAAASRQRTSASSAMPRCARGHTKLLDGIQGHANARRPRHACRSG